MANAVKLANKARTILAQGLETLQAEKDAPKVLMDIAAPIAQAMGIMHGIERSEGTDLERADEAMNYVRNALDELLSTDSNHPAVEPTVEAVATSLSKIFGLTRIEERAKAAAKAEAAAAKAEAAAAKAEAAAAKAEATAAKAEAAAAKAEAEAEAAKKERPSRRGRLSSRRAARAADDKKKSDTRAEAKTLKVSKKDSADGSSSPESSPTARDKKRPATSSKPNKENSYDAQVPGTEGFARPAGDAPNFHVELGAHSGSNFYKGLSGNDVIDHGGLFVATYQFPSRGTAITIKVHLPGDLDFTAEAIVQWTRDTRSGESEPGFGARVTRISAEGRQLVYRYVRNREPIFYDDF